MVSMPSQECKLTMSGRAAALWNLKAAYIPKIPRPSAIRWRRRWTNFCNSLSDGTVLYAIIAAQSIKPILSNSDAKQSSTEQSRAELYLRR